MSGSEQARRSGPDIIVFVFRDYRQSGVRYENQWADISVATSSASIEAE